MNENAAVLLTPQGREILARVAELQGDAPQGLICAEPAERLG
jgi:DNA-binding CsgD family transcriptional regulator